MIHKLTRSQFQSNNRTADVVLTRAIYREDIALLNEYLRPVGTYRFRFISSPPKETKNYLILIKPFDGYVWTFSAVSLLVVTITLIIIDTTYANWFGASKKDIVYQSK